MNKDVVDSNQYTASWPYFNSQEIAAVTRVLQSGKVNQWTGEQVTLFEQEFARYCGTKYAVAVANGSIALDCALISLGIGPGDEVIVPSRTFVATASCVALRGAVAVFADIDRDSQNITLDSIRQAYTSKTKAVIVVHLSGWPCQMEEIKQFCRQKGMYLIEDCAQAHGAKFKGKAVGSFGDIGCFSFCQDKIMTTGGEGGMVVTNNKKLWSSIWSYKDHGKDYHKAHKSNGSAHFQWMICQLGSNYRMTEMQAVLGRLLLKKLDRWVEYRRKLADIFTSGFCSFPSFIRTTVPGSDFYHSYYKYYAFLKPGRLKKGWSRDRVLHELMRHKIPCGVGICPEVYRERVFSGSAHRIGSGKQKRLPVAQELAQTSLMFLVHPTLRQKQVSCACEKICDILKKAGRKE